MRVEEFSRFLQLFNGQKEGKKFYEFELVFALKLEKIKSNLKSQKRIYKTL